MAILTEKTENDTNNRVGVLIFNRNDNSGRLIPVNELTRGIGKTTILIKRVLKEIEHQSKQVNEK